ncbi:MAG: hypothetical protein Q9214_006338 [Letrouitia sp. 1 TL-2023]
MGLTSWLGKKLVADDACLEAYRRRHTIVINRPKNQGGMGPGGMGPMATGPMGGQNEPGGPRYADEDAGGGRNPYAGSERSEDEGAHDVGAMSDPAYTTRGNNRGQRKRNGQRPHRGAVNGHGQRTPQGSQHGDPNGFPEDEYYDPYEDPHGYGGFDDQGGYGGRGMPGGYGVPGGHGIALNHLARHMGNPYGGSARKKAKLP